MMSWIVGAFGEGRAGGRHRGGGWRVGLVVHIPFTRVSDIWLSEIFVAEAFFASFLLTGILLTSTLIPVTYFYFAYVHVVIMIGLGFVVFIDG